jgi:adenine-specific DNA-methyltransferase
MKRVRDLEDDRLTLQAQLDAARPRAERNRLGQFATPTGLALDIMEYAKTLLPANSYVRFLDPAFGTGSFYSALMKTFPGNQIVAAEGFEIDKVYGEPTVRLWNRTSLKLNITDFTSVEPPSSESEKFNLLICNPPYVRHHHITSEEKLRLQSKAMRVSRVTINGLAGLYCYFMTLSKAWMTNNGIAGWLIPSEFMDVNYGTAVKEYLLNRVTLTRIHRFDPNEVQFDDALVSSAIVWYRNSKPPAHNEVEFTFGGTLKMPEVSKRVSSSTLSNEPKWTRFPLIGARELVPTSNLRYFFTIKRGLATGYNRFFILSREQIDRYSLPMGVFKPILPSPRHLKSNEILADPNRNPIMDSQLFLLDCKLPEQDIREQYPSLWHYLQLGEARGAHERYLCSHRSPWYVQENRPPPEFFCTYMGRTYEKHNRPFRFIINYSNATASNVYLLMYAKPMLAYGFEDRPPLMNQVWEYLNNISPAVMLGEGRVYGGGLFKLEPSELGNIPADGLANVLRL